MLSGAGAVVGVTALVPGSALAQSLSEADQLVRVGEYNDAIRAYRRMARAGDVAAGRGLVRTLMEVGRYDDAEQEARALDEAQSPQLSNVLGEVLYYRGRIDGAEQLFQAAIGGASDSVVARLNLAISQYERGERDLAFDGFDRDSSDSIHVSLGDVLLEVAEGPATHPCCAQPTPLPVRVHCSDNLMVRPR